MEDDQKKESLNFDMKEYILAGLRTWMYMSIAYTAVVLLSREQIDWWFYPKALVLFFAVRYTTDKVVECVLHVRAERRVKKWMAANPLNMHLMNMTVKKKADLPEDPAFHLIVLCEEDGKLYEAVRKGVKRYWDVSAIPRGTIVLDIGAATDWYYGGHPARWTPLGGEYDIDEIRVTTDGEGMLTSARASHLKPCAADGKCDPSCGQNIVPRLRGEEYSYDMYDRRV